MYAIIDIETTGGSYKNEKITEIAIFIHDGKKVIDEFVSLVNPEKGIPYFITSLTGITNEMVEYAPRFYEIAKEIVEITKDKIFVAHNASFDYGFVRNEFKNLGFDFSRKQLCTVKLSRKLIPGFQSYSLGKLCDNLGIEINGRHRAAGDALATVKLFEILLKTDTNKIIDKQSGKLSFRGINPELDLKIVSKLPDKPGVYYFFNNKDSLIYIGKSKNIKKRVISHLSNETSAKAIEMKRNITNINYETTGNELIALLLESDEIKKHKPLFNRAQRRSTFNTGIFTYIDQNSYLRLQIEKNSKKYSPLTSFSSQEEAKNHLFRLVEEFSLCQKLCGLYTTNNACFHYSINLCNGACIGKESPNDYNKKVEKAIEKYEYEQNNFLIIDTGRNNNEKSVIHVENGKYLGFGYFNPEYSNNNIEFIKDAVKQYADTRDVQQIIKGYLKRNKVENIITL